MVTATLDRAAPTLMPQGKRRPARSGGWGLVIRQAREARELNQAELARKVGVEPSTISRLEAGKLAPSEALANRLASALGISLEELLWELGWNITTDEERFKLPTPLMKILSEMSEDEIQGLLEFLRRMHRGRGSRGTGELDQTDS